MSSSPQRTCIACRQRRDQRDLARFALIEGQVRRLEHGPSQGRSAYACPTPQCLERALNVKTLSRVFRKPVSPDSIPNPTAL
ncbi:MAG: YlxR family protein [Methanoregulaceae archaeon]|nr:YlxR family protein [Methanoregulaceae archaeon]